MPRILKVALLLLAALPWAGICDDKSVVEWMASSAIRLETAEAGHDLADMEPLKRVIGDARIVALGDATRGTHEFFELRHRMLEFLATRMGFTIFAMEANMPETYLLNEFVQHGTGDPAALLRGTGLWTMDTREMIDLIQWMRDFNQSGKGHLEVAGFDMLAPDLALKNVRAFVSANDPGYIAAVGSASDLARTASTRAVGPNFGYAIGTFPAGDAAGKRVRFSAYIKTKGITRGEASLFWRVEGPTGAVTFESLQGRGATGTAEWKLYQMEIAVPADARNITFGALHNGDGLAWFNSLAIELDGLPYLKKDRFDLDFESTTGFDIGGNRYAVRRDEKEF